MVCLKDGVLALVLMVMTLALSGCGSSSGGNSPSPPPAGPVPPVDFVSQSVEGTIESTQTANGTTVTAPPAPFSLFIDADEMNMHVEASITLTEKTHKAQGQLKATINVTAKRLTFSVNGTVDGKHQSNCSYLTSDLIPDPASAKTLISSILQAQPMTRAADGNKQMVLDDASPSPKVKGHVHATIEYGDDNVLRKLMTDVTMTAPVQDVAKGKIIATKTSAGVPDASKFKVDKSWGDCKKVTPPQLDDDLNFPQHIKLPLMRLFQMMEIKPQTKTETQSDLIAI